MRIREVIYKTLLILMICGGPTLSIAQEQGASETAPAEAPSLSPLQLGLQRAREFADSGNRALAVEELKALFGGGFAAPAYLLHDESLGKLAGYGPFDALLADMEVQAYPCDHMPALSQFDFWLGEWEVHGAGGQFAGNNTIRKAERGCVILESWRSASGGTGSSINFYDGASDEWVQMWTDASGGQIHIRGGLTDDGMLLEGTWYSASNDTTLPFRGLWTLQEDGRVRQFFEQSSDGGETWTTWFDGFYTRKGDE